eukprot:scaffold5584_cov153-Skeletonema_marinoi.AAC.1
MAMCSFLDGSFSLRAALIASSSAIRRSNCRLFFKTRFVASESVASLCVDVCGCVCVCESSNTQHTQLRTMRTDGLDKRGGVICKCEYEKPGAAQTITSILNGIAGHDLGPL